MQNCPLIYVPIPQGEFGPFNPSMQTQVPLWLAVNLRQRQKCHIVPPQWLNVGREYSCMISTAWKNAWKIMTIDTCI